MELIGVDGQDGEDGYTPQRGTDYWTASDKAEIISDVETDIATSLSAKVDKTSFVYDSGTSTLSITIS